MNCAETIQDRPGQPAYEIKLVLSRVSWALAQISCWSQLVTAAAAECMKQTTQSETIYLLVLYARTKNLTRSVDCN